MSLGGTRPGGYPSPYGTPQRAEPSRPFGVTALEPVSAPSHLAPGLERGVCAAEVVQPLAGRHYLYYVLVSLPRTGPKTPVGDLRGVRGGAGAKQKTDNFSEIRKFFIFYGSCPNPANLKEGSKTGLIKRKVKILVSLYCGWCFGLSF